MTKPHRLQKKIFPRFPILLAPLVLSCALAVSASAQDAPATPVEVEAAPAADAVENNAPERKDAQTETVTEIPKAEVKTEETAAVNTATPDATAFEDKTAGPAAQAENGAEAQAAQGTLNKASSPNAESARRQPASVFQSERIKPRAFGGNAQAADPASRARSRQKRLEGIVRGVMSQAGFTDLPMQGYIAAHMANEDQARGPLRKKGEQLFLALRSARVTNVQIDELLREFQKALDDDKVRRLQCEANLDAKIGYTKNARLQAVLVLFGIIGDGALFVPLREPPRPRPTVPVKSDGPTQPLDKGTVNAAAVSAAVNAAADTAEAPQAAAPKTVDGESEEADDAAVKAPAPATYDVSTTQPAAKDRASFK